MELPLLLVVFLVVLGHGLREALKRIFVLNDSICYFRHFERICLEFKNVTF